MAFHTFGARNFWWANQFVKYVHLSLEESNTEVQTQPWKKQETPQKPEGVDCGQKAEGMDCVAFLSMSLLSCC